MEIFSIHHLNDKTKIDSCMICNFDLKSEKHLAI